MNRKQFLIYVLTAVLSFALVIGFTAFMFRPVQASSTLLISAAASLRDALEDMKPLYQTLQPRVTLTFNFGASGALLQQIEQGAPADIFISAGQKQMDELEKMRALIPGTQANLANNKLALIIPKDSRRLTGFVSLKNAEVKRIVMGEPRSVPAGQYAEQVLQKLNLLSIVRSKLVFANNVRQVLSTVESGNADAGFVYITDAKISNKVKVAVVADDNLHSPIVYPMAVLKRSKNINAAQAFVTYLSSSDAKRILRKYGFTVN